LLQSPACFVTLGTSNTDRASFLAAQLDIAFEEIVMTMENASLFNA